MASTLSVSKGVFAFRRQGSRKTKEPLSAHLGDQYWRMEADEDPYIRKVSYAHYQNSLNFVSQTMKDLQDQVHNKVMEELVQFVQKANDLGYNASSIGCSGTDIPTACLLTGVNMPDHGAVYTTVVELLAPVTHKVIRLHSTECINIRAAVTKMVSKFMSRSSGTVSEADDYDLLLDDEDDDVDIFQLTSTVVKKSQCTMAALEKWFQTSYSTVTISPLKSPKKKKVLDSPVNGRKQPLVVIIEDTESFIPNVLQDLVLICHAHLGALPFVFVLGVSTTQSAVHRCLSQEALSCLSVETFQAQPSTVLLSQTIDKILMSPLNSVKLGAKTLRLLVDIFTYHNLSVSNFVSGYKFCMLQHYTHSDVSILCTTPAKRRSVLRNIPSQLMDAFRELPSYQKYSQGVSNGKMKSRQFWEKIEQLLADLDEYYIRFCFLVRILYCLVQKLPGRPLGTQIRSVMIACLVEPITDKDEFLEAWKLLKLLSRDELSKNLLNAVDILAEAPAEDSILRDLSSKLQTATEQMKDMENMEIVCKAEESRAAIPLTSADRFRLREKLLSPLLKPNKPLTPYELVCEEVTEYLRNVFNQYLVPPSLQPLHEIMFFDDVSSIKNCLTGPMRASITKALSNPNRFLQCQCCSVEDPSIILPSMPDLCIAYKLHLEAGRLVNLYDWLESFVAVLSGVGPVDEDDESSSPTSGRSRRKKKGRVVKISLVKKKKSIDPALQARFVQAVAELQFLGFVKRSGRKADHVTRLTWGGI